jgi:hypothetical protein
MKTMDKKSLAGIFICGGALLIIGSLNLALGEQHECAFKIGNIILCQDRSFRAVGLFLALSGIGLFFRRELARKMAVIFCIINMAQLVIKFGATALAITFVFAAAGITTMIYLLLVYYLTRPGVVQQFK